MRHWILILVPCLSLGAVDSARVLGVTATQAIVGYRSPDTNACTIEVSDEPGYSPVVNDVNDTLFAGSNSDSRPGNVVLGRNRIIVIGKRAAEPDATGLYRSRALEADRLYFGRVTCGSDTVTFTFRTGTVTFGNVRSDTVPGESGGVGEYAMPDFDYSNLGKVIDPLTGVAVYPVLKPRDYEVTSTQNTDTCSGWGTCQVVSDDATYSSASTTTPLLVLTNMVAIGDNEGGPCGMIGGGEALDNVQVEINGYGAGSTTGERTVNVCLTRDNGLTCSASKQVVLPATDGTVNAGSSTTVDLWESKLWSRYEVSHGKGWISTPSATPTTSVTFANSDDCNRFRAGSQFFVFPSGSQTLTTLTIQSLSCPAAVVDTAVNLYNAGLGVPFNFPSGLSNGACTAIPNKGFGVKIWKANGDSQTVYVDRVRFKLGHTPNYFSGAGGFHNQCSAKDTSNGGWYKCLDGVTGNPQTMMYAIRRLADGEPEVRSLGNTMAYSSECGGWIFTPGVGGAARPWDAVDPNSLWVQCSGGIAKQTYTGNYTAKAPNQGVPAVNAWAFTKITGSYTNRNLFKAFADANGGEYDPFLFPGWGILGVQGPYIIMAAIASTQDTIAWYGVLDVGNKLPFGGGWQGTTGGQDPLATDGTGFVVAMAPLYDRPSSRWCSHHTYEWVTHEPVVQPEWQNLYAYRYGGGPYRTTLKTAIPQCTQGTNCTNVAVTVDSTWDTATWRNPGTTLSSSGTTVSAASGDLRSFIHVGSQIRAQSQTRTVTAVDASGTATIDSAFSPDLSSLTWEYTFPTAPAWWHDGDPIGMYAPWAIAKIDVGSRVLIDNEYLTVVSRAENAGDLTITFSRQGVCVGCVNGAHTIDDTIEMRCCREYSNYWYFTQDKTASTSNYYAPYDVLGNPHGAYGNGIRVNGEGKIQVGDIKDYQNWNIQTHSVNRVTTFAGKAAPLGGNSYQGHPSKVNYESTFPMSRTWFDTIPFQGTNLFSPQNNTAAQRVSGFTHVYKYTYTEAGRVMYRKHLDTFGVAGGRRLRDISGPGGAITDGDTYTMCVADVAGECVSGSTAGSIYLNIPHLAQSYSYCAAGEVSALGYDWDDACAGETSMFAQAAVQGGVFQPSASGIVVSDNKGSFSRALVYSFLPYRWAGAFFNFRPLPDTSFATFQGYDRSKTRIWWLLTKVPPLSFDSVNRSTFIPVRVQLTPPSGLAANNAVVEFGYNPSFYCTARAEKCVANSAAVNETSPFTWPTEAGGDAGITGLSCSSGCTVAIPALSQRVLYYRWIYRNVSNAVIATSATQVVAVP